MKLRFQQHRNYQIVLIPPGLSDQDLLGLQEILIENLERDHAESVLLDLTHLDILDCSATRICCVIAQDLHHRGIHTILIGIQEETAFTMKLLGLDLDGIDIAPSLRAGLALLEGNKKGHCHAKEY
jgi:anti-anti-sigma factor